VLAERHLLDLSSELEKQKEPIPHHVKYPASKTAQVQTQPKESQQ
jgi:hypothetical protein